MPPTTHPCLDRLLGRSNPDSFLKPEAKQSALKACRIYFSSIVKAPEFYQLEYKDLSEMIRYTELNCDSEEQIFDALNLWANMDTKRCFDFEELLKLVRFNFIDVVRLESLLEHELLSKTFHGLDLVKNAITFKKLSDNERIRIMRMFRDDPQYQRRVPVECFYVVSSDRALGRGKLWCISLPFQRASLVGRVTDGFSSYLRYNNSIYCFSPYGTIGRYDILLDFWQTDYAMMEDCNRVPVHRAVSVGEFIYTLSCANKVGGTYVMRKYDPTTQSSTNWKRKFHELGEDPEMVACQDYIYIFSLKCLELCISGLMFDPVEDTVRNICSFKVASHLVRPIFFSVGEYIYCVRDSNITNQHQYMIDQYDPLGDKWVEGLKTLTFEQGTDILDGQTNSVVVDDSRVYFFGKSCNIYKWKPSTKIIDDDELTSFTNNSLSDMRNSYMLI